MKLLILALSLCLCHVAYSCSAFSEDAQNAIVDAHNYIREAVAAGAYGTFYPGGIKFPGSNVLKMHFSQDLADSAQARANSCPTSASKTGANGENVFTAAASSDLDSFGKKAVLAWEAQGFKAVKWDSVKYDQTKASVAAASAFIQIIWGSSGEVGCGVNTCGKNVVVVCQYSDKGNILNQNIYTSGRQCDQCPDGTSCSDFSALCDYGNGDYY